MRVLLIVSGLLFVAGCGKSKEPVDLSIDNPKKAKSTATPDVETPDVETPENARKLLIQAAKLARQGLVGKSIELLSHAISMNSEDPELYIARAEVYSIMREDANALADYSVAIRVRPDDASIHNRRGFFLLSRNEHARALKDFSAAIRLNPKSSQAYNNRGLVYLSLKQTEKAVADFGSALQIDPEYADAWNNRGYAQYRRQKYPAAIKDLTEAIRRKPDYLNALNNRAIVYNAMEQYESAIADFSAAIRKSPNEIKLLQARRAAYLKLERYDEARDDKSRVQWLHGLAEVTREIDREPRSPAHYLRRGEYLAKAEEHNAAIRDFSRAAKLDNTDSTALIQRAQSLLALREYARAIRDCDSAIEMGKEHPDPMAYSVRGDIWMAKKSFGKAIADFERSGRFDTSVANAYLMRAAAFDSSGEPERAKADRQRAAAIDPQAVIR